MKILVICAGDRSKHLIALSSIKHLKENSRFDELTVCVLDNNKKIVSYLKKNKIKFINKNVDKFLSTIKKKNYDWLLNIWGFKIFKKKFLEKFENNLNLHPAFLPYNRGRDPYYFALMDRTPAGICIHRMDETVDGGKYFLRKRIFYKFPIQAGKICDKSLKSIKELFIKNWLKIRSKQIKLKRYSFKIRTVNKRKDLIKQNFKDLDLKNEIKIKKFVMNCLAQDFDFLKQQIKIFGKVYDCKLELNPAKKKKW